MAAQWTPAARFRRTATDDYLDTEDHIRQWLEDRCLLDRQCWTASSVLFADYQQWCKGVGERERSQKRFTQELEARGFEKKRTSRAKGFQGIALTDLCVDRSGDADGPGSATCAGSDDYRRIGAGARTHTGIT